MNFRARKFLGHLKRHRLPKLKMQYRFEPFSKQCYNGGVAKRNCVFDTKCFKKTWSPGRREHVFIMVDLTYESKDREFS